MTDEYEFTCEYSHVIDAKHRTSIPPQFREELGERFYMMRGYGGNERCILVFPEDRFSAYKARVRQIPLTGQRERDRERTLRTAMPTEFAPNGRVTIPAHLLEYAMIDKEITSVGNGDHIEIWSRKVWKEYSENNMTMDKEYDNE